MEEQHLGDWQPAMSGFQQFDRLSALKGDQRIDTSRVAPARRT
jgi:hypothetical protein